MTFSVVQGMTAETSTVVAFNRANAELGGGLRISAPLGAMRSYAQQLSLYRLYQAGRGEAAWHPDDPRANHMKGISLDINNQAAYPTLRTVMAKYGFARPIAGEPWHYEYRGTLSPAGGTTVPITGEEDMAMTAADAHLFWTYLISNENGVPGRAADWLANGMTAVGRVEATSKNLPTVGHMDVVGQSIVDGVVAKVPSEHTLNVVGASIVNQLKGGAGTLVIDYDALAAAIAPHLPAAGATKEEVLAAIKSIKINLT